MPPAAEADPPRTVLRMVRGFGHLWLATVLVSFLLAAVCLAYAATQGLLGKVAWTVEFWGILALGLFGLPLSVWLQARIARTAQLTLDERGLGMQSGLPPAERWMIRSDWVLRWDQVAEVVVLEELGAIHIKKKGGLLPWAAVLRPRDWVEEGGKPAKTMRESVLWRTLADRKLLPDSPKEKGEGLTFDMWAHPATRVALVAAAALVAYAVLDGMFQRETWADFTLEYYFPHFVVAIAASAACGLGLHAVREPGRVPESIIAALAMVLGVSAGIASYVGLTRVNQLVGGPLETKIYRRNAACNELMPVDRQLPKIGYSDVARDYWCSFPADFDHEIPVRRGLMGLYQLDLSLHTEMIRSSRKTQR